MHTVELLKEAIGLAERLGFRVRNEWLGGSGGGDCVIRGQPYIFLDLAVGPEEQLDQMLSALRRAPDAAGFPMPHELRELIRPRKTA